MDVKIMDTGPVTVAVMEHRGDPVLINQSVARFIEWRKSSGESPINGSKTFGIAYDDPATTAPDAFRFDICGSVKSAIADNPQGVKSGLIPGGRCAVVRHVGSHDNIGESIRYLFREWLPGSGEELRDFPVYIHYLNLKTDVPESELVSDIYLPLQ